MAENTKPFVIDSLDEIKEMFRNYWSSPGGWSSSAKNLDDDLLRAGYKIDYKFYHPYVLPDTPQKMENLSNLMWLYSDWQEIIDQTAQTVKRPVLITPGLEDKLNRMAEKMAPVIVKTTMDLKSKNPNLGHIVTPSIMDMVHFIRGAIYGYPPENIEFWVRNYKKRAIVNKPDIKYKPKLMYEFGINTGLMRLTDTQAQMLMTELYSQRDKIKRLRQATQNVDSLGREDKSGYLRFMERQYGDD